MQRTRTQEQTMNAPRVFYIVRVSVMWAFIFAAIAGIPYALDQVRAQYVEQLNKAAGAAQTGSAPRHRPGAFPANRIIREGTSGTERKTK
jgi:hypothetical protein